MATRVKAAKRSAESRIAGALGSMPYGALASSRARLGRGRSYVREGGGPTTLDLEVLAEYLEALRDILSESAASARARDAQAATMAEQLEAVGAVLAKGLPRRRAVALLRLVQPAGGEGR